MTITLENLMQKYEKVIQDQFKVKNPYLLKTGTLGTLVNILAHQELDLFNYYNKSFQEIHPALANDYNSMIFHSDFYGIPISFAKPARFSAYLKIPEINTEDAYYYEYYIQENTEFQNNLGYDFIIPERIEIKQDSSKVKAYVYSETRGKQELKVIESFENDYKFYLIEYTNILQYSKDIKMINVPQYNFGESYYFDVPISNFNKLKEIKAWLKIDNSQLLTQNLLQMNDKSISQLSNLIPLNIKFFNYDSSKFDYDLFLDIKNTTLSFKTGNGIKGKILPPNSKIILKIETTEGINGNLDNLHFNLNNIFVKKVNLDKNESEFKTTISGFSIENGHGGETIESVDSLRKKIFKKIQLRNSILTESDFEKAFEYEGTKPLVDAKFINNNAIVYLFNVLKYRNKIIETLSTNISEIDLSTDPFYPTWSPASTLGNNKQFISPFYFKRQNENIVDLYAVNPKIQVPLFTSNSYDLKLRTDNEINLYILYDFITRKSKIKITNTHDKYTYKIICNQFNHTFTFGDNFEWEIDSYYTDKYCIIKKPLYDFHIQIFDDKGNQIIDWYNRNIEDKFYQLNKIQEIYKYYQKQDNDQYTLEQLQGTVSEEYLDNQLQEIISTVEQLYYPIQNDEMPYLLRVPFIDKDFFDTINYEDLYFILISFFKIEEYKNQISLTTRTQQTFYNTFSENIELYSKYQDYYFKYSDNIINSPKIDVDLEIILDKNALIVSKYNNTTDLEFDLKIKIIEFLIQKEGFNVEFYDSELENYLLNEFKDKNTNKNIIKNINLISPKLFITNSIDNIYYKIKTELNFESLLEFVPPYFYYDYNNINIKFLNNI